MGEAPWSDRRVAVPASFMPRLGLGCWQSSTGEVGRAIEWAVEAGGRLVDTSFGFGNEREIGQAIRGCIAKGLVTRQELFIVTKLPMFAMRPSDIPNMFERSLFDLGLDYLDLYLLQGPIGLIRDPKTNSIAKDQDGKVKVDPETDLIEVWRAMESLVDAGRCRAIGVSNCNSEQLERLSAIARRPIAVNQVECNVSFQQKKLRATMARLGIELMAYAPLGSPGRDASLHLPDPPHLLDDPTVVRVSRKYSKTPAQVLIRYLLQLGFIVIPKSVKQHRIKENFDVWDFTLSDHEMTELNSLDQGSRNGRTFNLDFLPTNDKVEDFKEYPFKGRDEY